MKEGLEASQLSAVAYGEYHPIASNTTLEGRTKNRRIVLVITRNDIQYHEMTVFDFVHQDNLNKDNLNKDSVNQRPASITPHKTKSGGLLFSSDPDIPREN